MANDVLLAIGAIILIIGAVLLFFASGNTSNSKNKRDSPPPLPSRSRHEVIRPGNNTNTNRRTASLRPLPARRNSSTGNRSVSTYYNNTQRERGPRGIRPSQYPCCPFDKQRNVEGEPQKIFWKSAYNYYECSRGHRFMANGKPM